MAFQYSPKIITDGLVLALDAANQKSYPGSGTTWTDLSGNGKDGTLVNGASFQTTNGGSIAFDGVNDRVNLYASNQLIGNQYATLEVWMKSSSTGAGSGGYSNFLGTRVGQNMSINRYSTTNTAVFLTDFTSGNLNVPIGSINVFDQNWHHIVGVNNFGICSLYVDGTLEGTNSTKSGQYIDLNAEVMAIGNDTNNTTRTFYGEVSVARIYNRALTADDVLQNYNTLKSRFGI
jgi:hypothetical protein